MSSKNKTKYAILGMLSFHSMSGYDIKKDIEENLSLFWNESYGQIYSALRRLEDEGLVDKRHVVQEGRPDKWIYTLTESGRGELVDYLKAPAKKMVVRDEMILKFIFSFHVAPECSISVLENEIERLESARDSMEEKSRERIEAETNEAKAMQLRMLVDLGWQYHTMRLAWCRKAKKSIEERMSGAGGAKAEGKII